MKIITATLIDPTHLELSQPLAVPLGASLRIAIPEEGEEEDLWRAAAKQHFLDAYGDQDALYDDL
jgi:hypothetical protein